MSGRASPTALRSSLLTGLLAVGLLTGPAGGLWPGAGRVAAQSTTTVRGYLEHQFSTARGDDGWSQLDYDRLRIDLDAGAGRDTRVSAALVWQYYRGNTHVLLRDILPPPYDDLAGGSAFAISDRHSVNHLYMALDMGPVEVTAGKQYLTWGAAMAFNPTELFRAKNLFEPSYEREGIGALSGRLQLGPLSDLLIAYVPVGSFTSSGKVLRVRHQIGIFGLSVMAAEVWQDSAPSGFGVDAPPALRRRVLGGDFSGELFGMGIWAESAWSTMGGESWFEATLGGNYSLADGTLIFLEGYFDDRGEWTEPYSLGLWLDRLAGNRRSVGKGLVFGGISRMMGQLWTIGLNGVGNTGDRSFVFIPAVSWAFAQDVDLIFNGAVPVGKEGTEFGDGQMGGFIRARVYF